MSIEKVVDRESEQKLYVQIHAIFKTKIESSEWLCGVRIPPEDELCITYNVSKATIRIAIAELVRLDPLPLAYFPTGEIAKLRAKVRHRAFLVRERVKLRVKVKSVLTYRG